MKAFLLSAGLGTRLQPFTNILAKPAIPFLQIPMLAYSAELLQQMGADRLIVNRHHLPATISKAVSQGPLKSVITYSDEPELLGSGGGLLQASKFFGDQRPWVMANADEIFVPERSTVLADVLHQHRQSGSFATLLVQSHPLAGTIFGAVWVSEDGQVRGFGRQALAGCTPWHYLGYLVVEPEIQNFLPPLPAESNILYQGLAAAIGAGYPVRIYRSPGFWHETGNLDSYLEATEQALELLPHSEYLQALRGKWNLEPCPLEHSPSGATILWGPDASLASKGLVQNFAVLGRSSQVSTAVSRVVIGDDVSLSEPGTLQNTLIL